MKFGAMNEQDVGNVMKWREDLYTLILAINTVLGDEYFVRYNRDDTTTDDLAKNYGVEKRFFASVNTDLSEYDSFCEREEQP